MPTSVAAGTLEASYLTGTWRSSVHEASYRLPTAETVRLAASMLDTVPGVYGVHARTVSRFGVELSPGTLRVRARGPVGREGVLEDGLSDLDVWLGERVRPSAFREPDGIDGEEWDGQLPLIADAHPGRTRPGVKRAVVEWSRKSRLNMARVLASLDWAGHIEAAPAGWRPQMLTLTLPGDWLAIAPDGAEFKRLFRVWLERWRRQWKVCGRDRATCRAECEREHKSQGWAGCWKLEFQRRGAPHLHLYGIAPVGVAFREWLSRSWYEVCGSGDERHLRAGTGVDWREGIRATDPRQVALYFLGRSVGHNYGDGKEYQHIVPEAWQAAGKGPGRFWGHRGLERCSEFREVDGQMFVRLRRLARRWAVANGRTVKAAGWGRWQGYTLLLPDAPVWLVQASRWEGLGAGDGERVRRISEVRGADPWTGERLVIGPRGQLP